MKRIAGQNRLSSLLLLIFASMLLWFGRDLPMGSLVVMGPAYIPFVLAGCLIVLGVLVGIRSIRDPGPLVGPIALRPILAISAAVLSFAFLLEPVGLLPAAACAVFLSALATPEAGLKESLLLAIGLAIFSAALFVWLLGVPVRVWALS